MHVTQMVHETPQVGDSDIAPAGSNGGNSQFPLRAKPEFYRQNLYKILTKSQGQAEGFVQVEQIVDNIEKSQETVLKKSLTPDEKRELRLRTYRDIRTSLLALSFAIAGTEPTSESQVRRTRNLPYLQWRIEKEILSLHWNCTIRDIENRQVRSGLRMSRYLSDAIDSEDLN